MNGSLGDVWMGGKAGWLASWLARWMYWCVDGWMALMYVDGYTDG